MTRPRTLDALFTPRSVAVVGASVTPGKLGHEMLRALSSFAGPLHPIHPRERTILGYTASPTIASLGTPVDLAVLCVGADAAVMALGDAGRAGVRAAVVCAGGFAEAGSDGVAAQRALADIARDTGIRVLGPNTSGFVNPPARLAVSFVAGAERLLPGRVALVAQSGGVAHALAFAALNEALGIRLVVGLGNAVDVDAAAVLEYLAEDDETSAIALHIEGVEDGRALAEAVRHVTARIPVVAMKVGRADVGEFARSHTGKLAGSWAVTRAALAQAGAVIVDDLTSLVDAARALSLTRLPAHHDPGVGLVTGQAGPGLVLADALRADGVRLPTLGPDTREALGKLLTPFTYQANPVDTGRPGPEVGRVLATVACDPAVDLLVTYMLEEPGALDPVGALRETRELPTVFVTGGPADDVARTVALVEADGIPVFVTPERGAHAVTALVHDARVQARHSQESGVIVSAESTVLPQVLDEHAAKTLLERAGLRAPRRRACSSLAEAHDAFAALTKPLVVKVLDAAVVHKTEIGGVHRGIDSLVALDEAFDATARSSGHVLVEEQAPPGVELVVAARTDAAFGSIAVVGLGGVAIEALGIVAFGLAPLSVQDAWAMVDTLPAAILDGMRALPPVDRNALAQVVATVAAVHVAHPRLVEIEINPLRATADGLIVLDALATLDEQPQEVT